MKYGTSFIFSLHPSDQSLRFEKKLPGGFHLSTKIMHRPSLHAVHPPSFSRMNTHSSPFSHSTHSNLHTLFHMQQRKQPCRTWFHEHFTEILSKSFFPALAVPFHPGSSGTPYRTPQTALFTFLSLKKKTMQNRYSFCGKQWTMPIHPGFLSAHLRRKE